MAPLVSSPATARALDVKAQYGSLDSRAFDATGSMVRGSIGFTVDGGFFRTDGYSPVISLAEAQRLGFIVATHLDGKPLALGGLGPLWAVYEPDRFPDIAAKPVSDRFALCPWGLYHIDVQAA